jgi:peptide-methionine (S)-S-oxide reductase
MTEITPFKNFYVAEDYHKNYYEKHREAPYSKFYLKSSTLLIDIMKMINGG